jgi:hypothetical protein
VISFALLSLPVFAVVALGWAAVKMRFVPPGATEALGAFSFRFALPALVLRLIAREPLTQSFSPRFFVGCLASGGLMFVLVFRHFASVTAARPSDRGRACNYCHCQQSRILRSADSPCILR